jgi:hypothetical protein
MQLTRDVGSIFGKCDMDITVYATAAIVVLCCGLGYAMCCCWKAVCRGSLEATEGLALRNSAAFALSCYWSRYYEGWSLVLFRDVSGTVVHVACETPEGAFFDAGGYWNEDQIVQRLGMVVNVDNAEETDVQSLLGTNNAVLEAADDFRHRVEKKGACFPQSSR